MNEKKMLRELSTNNGVTVSSILSLFQENHFQKVILPDKLMFKQKLKEKGNDGKSMMVY